MLTIIEVLTPKEICSQTYIVISTFDNEQEARNCADFMRLKFPRFLLGLRKITQHLFASRFSWVPKMDFKRSWTDLELYKYFSLTDAEQAYIEATIC